MERAPRPPDEAERLAELHSLRLIESGPDEHFDLIIELAKRHFDVPITLVTLIDSERQWFKSCLGIDGTGTDRDASFCTYTILGDEQLIINDALLDPRFVDNPNVTGDPFVRFYAGRPIHGPSGRRIGSLCVIDKKPRDFTQADREYLDLLADLIDQDLKDAELTETFRRVAQSGEVMDDFFEVSPTLLCVMDDDLTLTRANPAWHATLGWSVKELVGRGFLTLVHPSDLDEAAAYFADLTNAMESNGLEIRVITRDGHWRWVNLRHAGTSRVGVHFMTARDVTDARAIEEKRNQLVGVVSHELRNPLAAINGTVEMIEDGDFGPIPESLHRPLASISRNSSRMLGIANDLLDLERLEAGGIPLELTTFPLRELLADCVNGISSVCERAGLQLTTETDAGLCRADRGRLEQVLVNLVGNAAKFAPAGSCVEVNARSEGGQVTIDVRDHGRGIPADKLPTIFDRFAQSAKGDANFGAGLGLAIARGIVEQHGGELRAESEIDVGTTFTITLPEQPPSQAEAASIQDSLQSDSVTASSGR